MAYFILANPQSQILGFDKSVLLTTGTLATERHV